MCNAVVGFGFVIVVLVAVGVVVEFGVVVFGVGVVVVDLGVDFREDPKCNYCLRRKVGLAFVVDFGRMSVDHFCCP